MVIKKKFRPFILLGNSSTDAMFTHQCFSNCIGYIASRGTITVNYEPERMGTEMVMSNITLLSSIIVLEGLGKTIKILGHNIEAPG
jgi:hypothetical protein